MKKPHLLPGGLPGGLALQKHCHLLQFCEIDFRYLLQRGGYQSLLAGDVIGVGQNLHPPGEWAIPESAPIWPCFWQAIWFAIFPVRRFP